MIKIDENVFSVKEPEEAGQLRDTNGIPVHGIYLTQCNNIEKKQIINNGNSLKKFKYPVVERDFSSSMLNDNNLHFCKSWSWTGVDPMECIKRVLDGKKPMGFWTVENEEDYSYCLAGQYDNRFLNYPSIGTVRKYENSVMGMPFETFMSRYDNLPEHHKKSAVKKFKPMFDKIKTEYKIGVCVLGTFDENFDLIALFSDYCKYAEAMGADEDSMFAIWDIHNKIKDQKISEYLTFEFGKLKYLEGYIVAGLLLGYPIECTASILWMNKHFAMN